MSIGMSTEYHEAVRRGRSQKKFKIHLVVFISANLFLLVINGVIWRGYAWSIWPLLGWGVALVYHAISAYMPGSKLNEQHVREIMKTLKK